MPLSINSREAGNLAAEKDEVFTNVFDRFRL